MRKYNRSEIMRNAWNLVRTAKMNISAALKAAWALAKLVAKANELGENSWWQTYTVKVNNWVKYGKNRTYVEMIGISNGKVQKTYKVGFVDNLTALIYAA